MVMTVKDKVERLSYTCEESGGKGKQQPTGPEQATSRPIYSMGVDGTYCSYLYNRRSSTIQQPIPTCLYH